MHGSLFLINFTEISLRWIDSFLLWYFSHFIEAKTNHISLKYLFQLKDRDSPIFTPGEVVFGYKDFPGAKEEDKEESH